MTISLNQQIEEITAELQHRRSIWPGEVSRRKITKRDMEYRIDRLVAVLTTLHFLESNEAVIRDAIVQKNKAREL